MHEELESKWQMEQASSGATCATHVCFGPVIITALLTYLVPAETGFAERIEQLEATIAQLKAAARSSA